jgi:hypothetical protein
MTRGPGAIQRPLLEILHGEHRLIDTIGLVLMFNLTMPAAGWSLTPRP